MSKLTRALRRGIHVVSRPVRGDRGEGGILIQPYRGYGSREEVFLMGRVFRQQRAPGRQGGGGLARDLVDIGRRILRRGMAGAMLKVTFQGTEQRVVTDDDGYFRIHLYLEEPPPADRLWHSLSLRLVQPPGEPAQAEGEFFVPPETARHVVISDIDDTVMFTGVVNKAKMLWRLFLQGAESRVAFPGVAAFYRALHHGASGGEKNPMLYVSRAPWAIYEMLDEFFGLHRIPVGPILFLREWGITLRRPLPRRAPGHKFALIRRMLDLYGELPVILIGDSGQRDPEIYARVVREHPGRVKAVYIRNVSRDPQRLQAIEELAHKVAEAGSTLLLAADSFAMAEHAVRHGLMPSGALSEVFAEKREQQEAEISPTRTLHEPTPQAPGQAVDAGALEAALEERGGEGRPPSVEVEPSGMAGREGGV